MEHKTDTDSAADALILKLRDILDEARSYIGAPTFSPSMDSEAAVAVDLADQYLAGRASLAASAGSEPVAPPPLQHFESPRAKILMRAWQEGWDACRDAEYVGEDAQNDAFNQSSTVNHCVAEDILYTRPSPPEGMVGWKWVPIEPTVDQEWEGKEASLRVSSMAEACKIYKAMIAAAPPIAAGGGKEADYG